MQSTPSSQPMRWPNDFPHKHDKQDGWVRPIRPA